MMKQLRPMKKCDWSRAVHKRASLRQQHIPDLDGKTFGLEGDGAFFGGEGFAMVGQDSVDVNFDGIFRADDGHGVPFTERFFLGIRGAEPAFAVVRRLAFGCQGFTDAPEVAGIAVFELGFERFRPDARGVGF